MSEPCTIPPVGWTCSRCAGHAGPCAASPLATSITAKALIWNEPDADDWVSGLSEDCTAYADGIAGRYSVEAPKPVLQDLTKVKRSACVVVNGIICWKAVLWWAHDPFSFDTFDTLEQAKLAAEADWQTRFRALISGLPVIGQVPA